MKRKQPTLFDYQESLLSKGKVEAQSNQKQSKKKSKRTKLSKAEKKYSRTIHGGEESKGRRKEYRPLAENKWHHLTLKSELAKDPWSFLTPKNQAIIRDTLKEKSKKWGVKIAEVVNVGNHLHIKLKFKYRKGFQNFLRSVTSLIARKITNAKKGNQLPKQKHKQNKFWQGLAFTRVLKTSYEVLQLKGYFKANRIQAVKGEKAREQFLNAFNDRIQSLRKGTSSA